MLRLEKRRVQNKILKYNQLPGAEPVESYWQDKILKRSISFSSYQSPGRI